MSQFFDWHFYSIIVAILISGLLGGLFNIAHVNREEQISKRIIFNKIISGVVAAFTVPLFLNMISSSLLETSRNNILNLFVFTGFCIIAAVFSDRFLENIYRQLLQQVEKVQGETKRLEEINTEADVSDQKTPEEDSLMAELSEEECKVLVAMNENKYSYRSASGVAKQSGLSQHAVNIVFSKLAAKELVAQKLTSKDQIRWYLTLKGKQYVGGLPSNEYMRLVGELREK